METAHQEHHRDWQIKAANSDELRVVVDLRAEMANEMGRDWDNKHPGWRVRCVEYFSIKKNAGAGQVFCAVHHAGAVIGMTAVLLVDDYHGYSIGRKSGRVNMLYVVPAFRRQGLGRQLMEAALEWLKVHGCVVARLNASDEGQLLYESMGFKKRNEMEFFLS